METKLMEMESEDRVQVYKRLELLIHQVNTSGDFVREIVFHPDDKEFISEWFNSAEIDDRYKSYIQLSTTEDVTEPAIVTQSQIEYEWLSQHFTKSGMFEWLRTQGSPLFLSRDEMKILFLLEGVMEVNKRTSKLIVP